MEILLFLMVAIIVGALVFYLTMELPSPESDVVEDHPYPAVKIQPCKDACQAARKTSQVIFLSTQAPKLPLNACDRIADCGCQFRHFGDRRQHEDRRAVDYVVPEVLQHRDRRAAAKRVGRRVSDQYSIA
ncbi:MAG TPA: hypothetical protein VK999_05230 [Methylotenera sp.]|nr:hypothetical protein [Methylotenera sp.]